MSPALAALEAAQWKLYLDEGGAAFDPNPAGGKPCVVMFPAPNVTGPLHVGHGLSFVVQDALVRRLRMQGFNVHYAPGLDHAASRMENLVRRQVESRGDDWEALPRETKRERLWAWANEYRQSITLDLQRLGIAANWDEAWFTLDDRRQAVVEESFERLLARGLVYRATGVTNWCPEVGMPVPHDWILVDEYEGFTHRVQLDGGLTADVVDLETLLGAAAVAVSPQDLDRLGGKGATVVVPGLDRRVPAVVVPSLQPGAGAGILLAPALSARDFAIAQTLGLAWSPVYDAKARVLRQHGVFAELDVEACRVRLGEHLERAGALVARTPRTCYRVKPVACPEYRVLPLVTEQWYLKVSDLSEKAAATNVDFNVRRWSRGYRYWLQRYIGAEKAQHFSDGMDPMESRGFASSRDWLISSDLVWGQDLPLVRCRGCGHEQLAKHASRCEVCAHAELDKSEKIFDITFTCATWPRAVSPWPERETMTDLVITGHDVYLYWVANSNMIMGSMEGRVGYAKVHVHGLVVDEAGQKMTKSNANTISMTELVETHGREVTRAYFYLQLEGRESEPFISVTHDAWATAHATVEGLLKHLGEVPLVDGAQRTGGGALQPTVDHQLDEGRIGVAYRTVLDQAKNLAGPVSKAALAELLTVLHPFHPFLTDHIYRARLGGEASLGSRAAAHARSTNP